MQQGLVRSQCICCLKQLCWASIIQDVLSAAAGHRVQHEFAFLWKFHAKHHAIDTPSPFSTLFIHPVDAILQVRL
jgi:sterol desaturase/sphingolipid hydroxylase (fatty acid hydroxylase superfamily)